MLVVTRRSEQSTVIGDDIVVTVLEIRGDSVRLGIQAPGEVGVYREEVYVELERANRDSATSPAAAVVQLAALKERRDRRGARPRRASTGAQAPRAQA
jgi:carbon storage regulator